MIVPNYETSAKEKEIIIENLKKEKQELIDYLKDLVEKKYTNDKVK